MGKTLRGYLTREIVVRFAGGLALFTFIVLAARVIEMVDLVLVRGIPSSAVARLFLLVLPGVFEITAPVAALLAVLVTFTRLGADGELLALRAAGISWIALMGPVCRFGLACLLLCLVVVGTIRPAAERAFATAVYGMATTRATRAIEPRIFFSRFDGVLIYASSVDAESGALSGILLADERDQHAPTAVFAASGRIVTDESRRTLKLELSDGSSLTARPPRESYDLTSFSSLEVSVDLVSRWTSARQKPSQLAPAALWAATRAADENGDEARIELHRRLAFAFAALIFAALGLPLGANATRTSRGAGIAASVGVALLYYLLLTAVIALARRHVVPAGIALWLPNFLFATAAWWLMRRLGREAPLAAGLIPALRRLGGRS